MSNLVTPTLVIPPNTISVLVDFYDAEEKGLFAKILPGFAKDLPATKPLPTTDFLAYYLYYKKKAEVPGYATHIELADKFGKALDEFDGQIEFSNDSIRQLPDSLDDGTVERLGEAIGLSVASNLHGLHQADWTRIAITNTRKTLDYWHPWSASTGKQFIQIEAKGSSTIDNDRKTSSVSKHKSSIKKKKMEATEEERKTSVLYGTIGVIDNRDNSVARCWLVDPPGGVLDDPVRFKIVNRLRYIADLISLIATRSVFAASLQTRVASLEALKDITALDSVPLRKGNGDTFSDTMYRFGGKHNPLFAGKSVVIDGPVGGQVSVVGRDLVMFIGIREELIKLASQQTFTDIEMYRFDAGSVKKRVRCVVPTGRFTQEFEPILQKSTKVVKSGGYFQFYLDGHLHYTQSGLVIGLLPIRGEF